MLLDACGAGYAHHAGIEGRRLLHLLLLKGLQFFLPRIDPLYEELFGFVDDQPVDGPGVDLLVHDAETVEHDSSEHFADRRVSALLRFIQQVQQLSALQSLFHDRLHALRQCGKELEEDAEPVDNVGDGEGPLKEVLVLDRKDVLAI